MEREEDDGMFLSLEGCLEAARRRAEQQGPIESYRYIKPRQWVISPYSRGAIKGKAIPVVFGLCVRPPSIPTVTPPVNSDQSTTHRWGEVKENIRPSTPIVSDTGSSSRRSRSYRHQANSNRASVDSRSVASPINQSYLEETPRTNMDTPTPLGIKPFTNIPMNIPTTIPMARNISTNTSMEASPVNNSNLKPHLDVNIEIGSTSYNDINAINIKPDTAPMPLVQDRLPLASPLPPHFTVTPLVNIHDNSQEMVERIANELRQEAALVTTQEALKKAQDKDKAAKGVSMSEISFTSLGGLEGDGDSDHSNINMDGIRLLSTSDRL